MSGSKEQTSAERYVQAQLFALQDLGYRDFHARLMPTIEKSRIIGVRTPKLREFARTFSKQPQAKDFLECLPHGFYEENNLHMILIGQMKDYEECINALKSFLPYVDNWATCDVPPPRVFAEHLEELWEQIPCWIRSEHPFTRRYGIGLLLRFYLDEAFEQKHADMVAAVRSDEYYVNMMIAWYFATALAKQYEAILPYIENQKLDVWTHNKAIQKAIESYRITPEQKAYLRTLKRK